MTISSTTRKAGPFTGNGVTVAFPFAFKVFTTADVLAVQALTATGAETTKVLTTDYTVVLNADQNASPGGTLTMLVAPPVGTTLTLTSQVPNTQSTDLTNNGGFYPKVINDALDRATIQIQQIAASVGRALGLSLSAPAGVSTTLPNPVGNALLGWNSLGTAIQNFAGGASAAVSVFMANVVAAVDAAAARVLLGAAASGANTDITSTGNNTSTIYTTGGTATAYTLTPAPAYSAYAVGMSFVVNFHAVSGLNPTLQINGLATPPSLVKQNVDGTFGNIVAGDITLNHRSRVTLISATQALVGKLPLAQSGPAFSAYQSAAQSLVSVVLTKLQLQTEEFDTNNAFDSITNYRWTPGVAGYYLVDGGFAVATTQAGLEVTIYKNGVAHKVISRASANASSTAYGSAIVLLTATDYVELFVSQSAATQNTAAGAGGTYFQGCFLRGL